MISRIKKVIKKSILWLLFNRHRSYKENTSIDTKALSEFCKDHNDCVIKINSVEIPLKRQEKWVGAVLDKNEKGVLIPNSYNRALEINPVDDEISTFGLTSIGKFKWTGGGKYKGKIYGFPRSSNTLLIIDTNKKTCEEHNLGQDYQKKEHHYGGIITKDGILYQPPRDESYILKVNLNTFEKEKINILNSKIDMKLRYCGSVLYPTGDIFFLPERNEKVVRYCPKTNKISFVGKMIPECMAFGGVVAPDGCIYGFTLYNGIVKVDPKKNQAVILHKEICFGCYGTKLGINGRIYGIPGNGDKIWEYDPVSDELKAIYDIGNNEKAKCAGGFTDRYGNIYCAPAFGDKIYKICFQEENKIPEELFNIYFTDFY